ncbi:MAG: hypothetical protein H0X63_06255 [Flavobacteriales bacterium]|jgi:hypothetical protein|nr:hypothetical protein [Flavobacteriales bacterium]
MAKYWTLSVLLFGLSATAQVNVENDSIILWSKDRQIIWDDFLSEEKVNVHKYDNIDEEDASAVIVASIKIYPKEFSCIDIDYIEVVAQMNKSKSWAKFKTDIVLNHEQTHFDIAELYARKIRKEIKEFIEENKECDLQGISDIYYRLEEEHWQSQFLYDKEVRNCTDKKAFLCHNLEKQKEWDTKTACLLELYKDYELVIDIGDLEME